MSSLIHTGDALKVLRTLSADSVNCCITSPPYWGLRDYGVVGQLGLEKTPDEYVSKVNDIFREVRRVLRADGTLWLNIGDSYAGGKMKDSTKPDLMWSNRNRVQERLVPPGMKAKDLIGVPWRVAFALRSDGWYLRQDIIWSKPNPMPEGVTDRCTRAHEYIFLLSKRERYYYDCERIAEDAVRAGEAPGGNRKVDASRNDADRDMSVVVGETRNKRSVWTVSTKPYNEAHFATFPPKLIEPCILAGCPEGGTVLDPFSGAGTTGLVASRLGRNYIGIELNPAYVDMSKRRLSSDAPLFYEEEAGY